MKKIIILFNILCFTTFCYGSDIELQNKDKIQDPTFKIVKIDAVDSEEILNKFHLDEILQAPIPVLKKINTLIFDDNDQPIVYELFEGETKITSKKTKSDTGKYLYIPDIKGGVALIASGGNFVAAAHFVENNENKMRSFLEKLNDQLTPLETLTIYGGCCSQATSALGRILKEENLKLNYARIFHILFFGEMVRGHIEKSDVFALAEKLIDPHESPSSFLTEESAKKLLVRKKIYPCRVVVDCSDGSLVDLQHLITINCLTSFYSQNIPNFEANIVTIVNNPALSHFLEKKKSNEITQEEFDYRLKAIRMDI